MIGSTVILEEACETPGTRGRPTDLEPLVHHPGNGVTAGVEPGFPPAPGGR